MELRAKAPPRTHARPSIIAAIFLASFAIGLGRFGERSSTRTPAAPWGACARAAFRSPNGPIRCGGGSGERLASVEAWLAGIPIDPASLDREVLVLVPGVGPRLAERVMASRAGKPASSWSELEEVRGVGPRLAERIARRLGHRAPGSAGLTRPW